MDIVVRPTEAHEMRAAADTTRIALLHTRTEDKEWEEWGWGWSDNHYSVSAWDADRCVGHAGSFAFDTLVPGGEWIPTAGITRVGVLPTHARRGLLSQMMRRLLDDERASGKILSSLRASEAVIYSRFGFGVAGEAVEAVVRTKDMTVRGAAGGSFRLLTPAEINDVIPPLYTRMAHRHGAISRSRMFWKREFEDLIEGKKAESVVVHTGVDGRDDGYVHYQLEWDHDAPSLDSLGKGKVWDLFADSPGAELALWDYVSRISLARIFTMNNRPVDDLVKYALVDQRAYEAKIRWDEQWVRLLDVEKALAARSYRDSAPVTIAVVDPWYADNEACFRISPKGVARVDEVEPDLIAPIEAISAAYMGSTPWRVLVSVGRATANDPEAAARADALFTCPGTWSATFF